MKRSSVLKCLRPFSHYASGDNIVENGPYSQVCVLGLNIKTILRKKMAGAWVRWAGRGKKSKFMAGVYPKK